MMEGGGIECDGVGSVADEDLLLDLCEHRPIMPPDIPREAEDLTTKGFVFMEDEKFDFSFSDVSLDSSAATPGHAPNSPATWASPRSNKHTPTVGGASTVGGGDGSPDEWVFPRLVDATPSEVANAVQTDCEPSSRPLLEQEKWILSKIFQSSAPPITPKCYEEVVQPSTFSSLPEDLFDVSVQNYVSSHASMGMPSGISATPTGDSGAARDGSDFGAPSRDERAVAGSFKEQTHSSNSSKESFRSVSSSIGSCPSSGGKSVSSSGGRSVSSSGGRSASSSGGRSVTSSSGNSPSNGGRSDSGGGRSASTSSGSSGVSWRRGTGPVPGSLGVTAKSRIPRVTRSKLPRPALKESRAAPDVIRPSTLLKGSSSSNALVAAGACPKRGMCASARTRRERTSEAPAQTRGKSTAEKTKAFKSELAKPGSGLARGSKATGVTRAGTKVAAKVVPADGDWAAATHTTKASKVALASTKSVGTKAAAINTKATKTNMKPCAGAKPTKKAPGSVKSAVSAAPTFTKTTPPDRSTEVSEAPAIVSRPNSNTVTKEQPTSRDIPLPNLDAVKCDIRDSLAAAVAAAAAATQIPESTAVTADLMKPRIKGEEFVVSTTFEKEEHELGLVAEVGVVEDEVISPPSISVPSAHSTPKEEGLPGSGEVAGGVAVPWKEGESGSGLEGEALENRLISVSDAPGNCDDGSNAPSSAGSDPKAEGPDGPTGEEGAAVVAGSMTPRRKGSRKSLIPTPCKQQENPLQPVPKQLLKPRARGGLDRLKVQGKRGGMGAIRRRGPIRPLNGLGSRQEEGNKPLKAVYSSYPSFNSDENAMIPCAKVVHSPADKENIPSTPRSKWSPIKKKNALEDSCFRCTKRIQQN